MLLVSEKSRRFPSRERYLAQLSASELNGLVGIPCTYRRLNGANLKGGLPAAIGNLSNLVSL